MTLSLLVSSAQAVSDPCDGLDNDGDGLVDEFERSRTQEEDPACEVHFPDLDEDGFGDASALPREQLCLCPGYERFFVSSLDTDVDGEFDIQEGPEPQICEFLVEGETRYGHRIEGICHVIESSDCDDQNARIHPLRPTDPVGEFLDRADHDCNGTVWIAELDCDLDGALAWLPLRSAALAQAPDQVRITSAAQVGLTACTPEDPAPLLSCARGVEGEVQPTCDPTTGLWMVALSSLDPTASTDGVHLAEVDDVGCGSWDCDDLCPDRCEGLEEVCDGLDNDCADGANQASQTGGVPAAMLTDQEVVPGAVASDEARASGTLPFTCDPDAAQRAQSLAGCDPRERDPSVVVPSDTDPVDPTPGGSDTGGGPSEGDEGCGGCAGTPARGGSLALLLGFLAAAGARSRRRR